MIRENAKKWNQTEVHNKFCEHQPCRIFLECLPSPGMSIEQKEKIYIIFLSI